MSKEIKVLKECWNCGNFEVFYTKGFRRFKREDKGKCTKHGERIVGQRESCKDWKDDVPQKIVREVMCLRALEETLSDIAELKQILSEENAEKQAKPDFLKASDSQNNTNN